MNKRKIVLISLCAIVIVSLLSVIFIVVFVNNKYAFNNLWTRIKVAQISKDITIEDDNMSLGGAPLTNDYVYYVDLKKKMLYRTVETTWLLDNKTRYEIDKSRNLNDDEIEILLNLKKEENQKETYGYLQSYHYVTYKGGRGFRVSGESENKLIEILIKEPGE